MKTMFVVVAIVLAGCGKQEPQLPQEAASVQSNIAAPLQKLPYTADDWRRDFSSTFSASSRETDEDGITNYSACFEQSEGSCNSLFSGMKDGFRKVDHLTPYGTLLHQFDVKYGGKNGGVAFVDMRVVALECAEAVVAINPKIYAKNWLFMDDVAFMANGVVVYEKKAGSQDVKRNIEDNRIDEKWTFKIDTSDYPKFEEFAAAESKIIRISGEKGYITIAKDATGVFARDIIASIKVAGTINRALSDGGGPICESS